MDRILKKKIINTYDVVAKEYNIPKGIIGRDFFRHYCTLKLVEEFSANKKCKVLDVSAGYAIPSRILKAEGFDVHVTDSVSIAGEKTCSIVQNIFPFTRIDNLESDDLPFDNNTFDIVLWLATIEHLHNSPRRILNWMKRILKTNGILIIDTPNVLELRKRIMFLFGKSFLPQIQFVYHSDYHGDHHREYTKRDLEYVLRESDFKILSSEIVDTISSITLNKRINYDKRTPQISEVEQMAQFTIGWKLLSTYNIIKIPYSILVKMFPSFRDTLFIVGQKK